MIATHNPRRRQLLAAGGGLLLFATVTRYAQGQEMVEIEMSGSTSGSHVWFTPKGLLVPNGTTVRWNNTDKGNSHTITAYHPDNNKPNRIPAGAESWDSGYIMPGDAFEHHFTVDGVYDYFCIPHEQAGMVGRIIVGDQVASGNPYASSDKELPEAAIDMLPPIDAILEHQAID